jgi:hypothetical protein
VAPGRVALYIFESDEVTCLSVGLAVEAVDLYMVKKYQLLSTCDIVEGNYVKLT